MKPLTLDQLQAQHDAVEKARDRAASALNVTFPEGLPLAARIAITLLDKEVAYLDAECTEREAELRAEAADDARADRGTLEVFEVHHRG